MPRAERIRMVPGESLTCPACFTVKTATETKRPLLFKDRFGRVLCSDKCVTVMEQEDGAEDDGQGDLEAAMGEEMFG